MLELTTYFNIFTFTAVKFYIQIVGGNHAAIAYASISIYPVCDLHSLITSPHHARVPYSTQSKTNQMVQDSIQS